MKNVLWYGTTAVVTAVNGDQLYWASVGDSRLYVYRDGLYDKLLQIILWYKNY